MIFIVLFLKLCLVLISKESLYLLEDYFEMRQSNLQIVLGP